MAPKTVGQAVLKFGTGADDAVYGIAENISKKPKAEKEQIRNGDNDTVGLIFSDIAKEISADFTPLTGATIDEDDIIGEEMTIDGDTFIVEDAELKYTKGKAATFNVKGTVYPNLATETPST